MCSRASLLSSEPVAASMTFSMTSRSSGLSYAAGPVQPSATIDSGLTELLMAKVAVMEATSTGAVEATFDEILIFSDDRRFVG